MFSHSLNNHRTNLLSSFRIAPNHTKYPNCVREKIAQDLISISSLNKLIKDNLPNLNSPTHSGEYIAQLKHHAIETMDDAFSASQEILLRFGRYLGYIIRALLEGDEQNRQSNKLTENEWQRLQQIDQVFLYGDLLSMPLGGYIRQGASCTLVESCYKNVNIRIASHALNLSLVGAARYAPIDTVSGQTIVVNLTNSKVQMAIAHYNACECSELKLLPTFDNDYSEFNLIDILENICQKSDDSYARIPIILSLDSDVLLSNSLSHMQDELLKRGFNTEIRQISSHVSATNALAGISNAVTIALNNDVSLQFIQVNDDHLVRLHERFYVSY